MYSWTWVLLLIIYCNFIYKKKNVWMWQADNPTRSVLENGYFSQKTFNVLNFTNNFLCD